MLPPEQRPSVEDLIEHVALKIVPLYKETLIASPAPAKVAQERLQFGTAVEAITKFIKDKPLAEVRIGHQ